MPPPGMKQNRLAAELPEQETLYTGIIRADAARAARTGIDSLSGTAHAAVLMVVTERGIDKAAGFEIGCGQWIIAALGFEIAVHQTEIGFIRREIGFERDGSALVAERRAPNKRAIADRERGQRRGGKDIYPLGALGSQIRAVRA